MKYGVCAWSLPGEFEDKMKLIAEIGFDGVSLGYFGKKNNDFLSEKNNREFAKIILSKYQLEFPTLGLNALGATGMSKGEDEIDVFQIMDEAVEIAVDMHVKFLQLPSFGRGDIQSEDELKQTIKCLRYLCEKTLPFDILVGHESVLNEVDCKRVIEEVGYENIFVYYDGGNAVGIEALDPLKVLEETYENIDQLHIKDRHQDMKQPLYLGEGLGKVCEICEILKKKNYDDWIILESEYLVFDGYKEILKKDYEIIQEMMK